MKYYNLTINQILNETQEDIYQATQSQDITTKNKKLNSEGQHRVNGYKIWIEYIENIFENHNQKIRNADNSEDKEKEKEERLQNLKNFLKDVTRIGKLSSLEIKTKFNEKKLNNSQLNKVHNILSNDTTLTLSNNIGKKIKNLDYGNGRRKIQGYKNPNLKKRPEEKDDYKLRAIQRFIKENNEKIQKIVRIVTPSGAFEGEIRNELGKSIKNDIKKIFNKNAPNQTLGNIKVKIQKTGDDEITNFSQLLKKGLDELKEDKNVDDIIRDLFSGVSVNYAKLFKQDTNNIITSRGRRIGVEIKKYNPNRIKDGVVFAELVALEKDKKFTVPGEIKEEFSKLSKKFIERMKDLLKKDFEEQIIKKTNRNNLYLAIGNGVGDAKFFSMKKLKFEILATGRGGKTIEDKQNPYRFTIMVSSKKGNDGKELKGFKKEINDRIQNDSVEKYLGDFLNEVVKIK